MKQEKNKLTFFVFGIYLLLLIWLILFKLSISINDIPIMRNINLIPFSQSVIINGKINYSEIIFNFLAFLPLGVYIKIIKPNWSFWRLLGICCGVSIFIEIIQYIFAIGGSDITDVISNTLGGLSGVLIYYIFKYVFRDNFVKIINIIGLDRSCSRNIGSKYLVISSYS